MASQIVLQDRGKASHVTKYFRDASSRGQSVDRSAGLNEGKESETAIAYTASHLSLPRDEGSVRNLFLASRWPNHSL